MKCWIKYVLPLVMAFCLFLGGSFHSRAAETRETSTEGLGYEYYVLACRDEIQESLDYKKLSFDDMYYYGYYDEAAGGVKVYVYNSPLECVSYTDTSFSCYVPRHDYEFVISADCRIIKSDYHERSSAALRAYKLYPSSFSSQDIYTYDTQELVFQGPSPFQRAVRTQDLAAVMMEIVIILPLLILSLTSLIGLRKGLRFVSSFLHRA